MTATTVRSGRARDALDHDTLDVFARHAPRTARPLLEVRLFRSWHFTAAAGGTFFIGAAIFGSMLVLPLYYQVARGQDALAAGLLRAPQGIGAALAMPVAGRLVDRIGGGRVVVAGCSVMALATIPLAFAGAHTSTVLLHGVLPVRGLTFLTLLPAAVLAWSERGGGP